VIARILWWTVTFVWLLQIIFLTCSSIQTIGVLVACRGCNTSLPCDATNMHCTHQLRATASSVLSTGVPWNLRVPSVVSNSKDCAKLNRETINQSINQSIKTDWYSTMCRKRIRGARWQGLGGVSSVKQFRLYHTGKSINQFAGSTAECDRESSRQRETGTNGHLWSLDAFSGPSYKLLTYLLTYLQSRLLPESRWGAYSFPQAQ